MEWLEIQLLYRNIHIFCSQKHQNKNRRKIKKEVLHQSHADFLSLHKMVSKVTKMIGKVVMPRTNVILMTLHLCILQKAWNSQVLPE